MNIQDRIALQADADTGTSVTVPAAEFSFDGGSPAEATTGPEAVEVTVPAAEFSFAGGIDAADAPLISGAPVLIRSPGKLGRIFHELEFEGSIYHPNLSGAHAQEEAPGGFGPSEAKVSERIFRRHRDVFQPRARWRWFHEPTNTCLHSGLLLPPDESSDGTLVQISDRGVASRAEREIGAILFQHLGRDGWTSLDGAPQADDTDQSTGVSHHWTLNAESTISWTFHDHASTASQLGMPMRFWRPGQDLIRLGIRLHVDGDGGEVVRFTVQALGDNQAEDWFSGGDGTVYDEELDIPGVYVLDIDLSAPALDTSHAPVSLVQMFPNRDSGSAPSNIIVEARDLAIGTTATGRMSPSELVMDLAGRIGMRFSDIEPSGLNILPWELEDGASAADGFDYASLYTGWRTLIHDTGSHAIMEFGPFSTRTYQIRSKDSPLDPVPQERFDRLRVPFLYADGNTVDSVLVRADPSPLDHKNSYGRLAAAAPCKDRDHASVLGQAALRHLVRQRYAGGGSAKEIWDPDVGPISAHLLFAGDMIDGTPRGEASRLPIKTLDRYDEEDHPVEFSFDGDLHALERMLARRARRQSVKHAA